MNNPNLTNHIENISNQRELLLDQNQDILFGVYNLIKYDKFEKNIYLDLIKNVLTCSENKISNIKWLDENKDISIINLSFLRKWKIEILFWNDILISRPVLLANWVIEYILSGKWKKHIITNLRDWWGVNQWLRTIIAWTNTWSNLHKDLLREYIEESPFLWKNEKWDYVLATISKNKEDLEILKSSIVYFLENKYNLDKSKEEDRVFITFFEKNFPWILYKDLWNILKDIIKNNRFKLYYFKEWNIPELENDIKNLSISDWINLKSKWEFFVYFDEQNNTIQYRKIQEITWFEYGFSLLSNRPSRLYLESQNQYPKMSRIENASSNLNLVPTIKYVCDKVKSLTDNYK